MTSFGSVPCSHVPAAAADDGGTTPDCPCPVAPGPTYDGGPSDGAGACDVGATAAVLPARDPLPEGLADLIAAI